MCGHSILSNKWRSASETELYCPYLPELFVSMLTELDTNEFNAWKICNDRDLSNALNEWH